MKSFVPLVAVCATLSLAPAAAQASPAVDTLAQCLVEHSSPRDQAALMRWMFAALSANPTLRGLSNPTAEQRDGYNKDLAATFERLALVDCRKEMVAAAKADGMDAVSGAFEVMGKRAAEQLLSDPAAAKELERFGSYLDQAKWQQLGKDAGLDAPKTK